MKPKSPYCLALSGLLLIAIAPSLAFAGEPIGWRSPLNPELQLTTSLSEALDLRFGINRMAPQNTAHRPRSWTDGASLDDVTFSALVDWDLTNTGGFRLTGGAFYGSMNLAAPAGTSADYAIDLHRSSFGEPPENRMLPYFGLGWDAGFGANDRLALQLDLGVVFESGALGTANDGSTDQAMQVLQEEVRLQRYFDNFRYSPVFSAGLRYRF